MGQSKSKDKNETSAATTSKQKISSSLKNNDNNTTTTTTNASSSKVGNSKHNSDDGENLTTDENRNLVKIELYAKMQFHEQSNNAHGGVRETSWSNDSRLLSSVGNDKKCIIYDIAKKLPLENVEYLEDLHHHSAIYVSKFSPDDKMIAIGTAQNEVLIFEVYPSSFSNNNNRNNNNNDNDENEETTKIEEEKSNNNNKKKQLKLLHRLGPHSKEWIYDVAWYDNSTSYQYHGNIKKNSSPSACSPSSSATATSSSPNSEQQEDPHFLCAIASFCGKVFVYGFFKKSEEEILASSAQQQQQEKELEKGGGKSPLLDDKQDIHDSVFSQYTTTLLHTLVGTKSATCYSCSFLDANHVVAGTAGKNLCFFDLATNETENVVELSSSPYRISVVLEESKHRGKNNRSGRTDNNNDKNDSSSSQYLIAAATGANKPDVVIVDALTFKTHKVDEKDDFDFTEITHKDRCMAVSFASKSPWLCTVGEDKYLHIVERYSGAAVVQPIKLAASSYSVHFAPNGMFVACGGADRNVYVFGSGVFELRRIVFTLREHAKSRMGTNVLSMWNCVVLVAKFLA